MTSTQVTSPTTTSPAKVDQADVTFVPGQVPESTDNLNISLVNSPDVIKTDDGKTALKLNGSKGQNAVLTPKPGSCLSNFALCEKGLTIVSEMKFLTLSENTRFISKGGELEKQDLQMRYKYGAINIELLIKDKTYYASSTSVVRTDVWYTITISLNLKSGLQLVINGDIESSSNDPVTNGNVTQAPSSPDIVLGSPSITGNNTDEKPADVLVSNFSIYDAPREDLITQGILTTG